jgi:ATP synthase protein I
MSPSEEPEERERKRQAKFRREVSKKAGRRARSLRQHDRAIMSWLGMMGLVGWSVALPAVLGAFLGQWIDATAGGEISWTITGVVVGIAVGCLTAWYWVKRESGGG